MFEQWFNSLDEYTIGALGMFIIMTYFIFIGWLMYGDPCSTKKSELNYLKEKIKKHGLYRRNCN